MSLPAALAAFVWLGAVSPGVAQTKGQISEAAVEEERLLGASDEEVRARELLPFTRSFGVGGVIAGSLAQSTASAGVPPAAMLEALRAFDGATGPREPQDGSSFYVRWQQTYSVEGNPIGIGRVLWAELQTADGGTVAIHRFRSRAGGEQFFLSTGEAATMPELALPLDDLTISSRFGTRSDPMARAPANRGAMGPLPPMRGARKTAVAARQAPRPFAGFAPRVFMHRGVDFAVPQGTPIYAASDGVVAGARPNGGYGNWIRLEHGDGIATVYAHLSRFAPRIKPGVRVSRGELVGLSGNTGRSTGPHLHFEVIADDKPVDPLAHAAVVQLAGPDLERLARQIAAAERERESEAAVATD